MANDKDFKVKNGLVVGAGDITSTTNTDITVTPSGTGQLVLDGLNWPTADGSANQVLKTDGSGQLSFVNQSGGSGSIQSEEFPTVTAGSADVTMSQSYALTHIEVYLNGVKLRGGSGNDFTVSGTTLTFSENLESGDVVCVVALENASTFTIDGTFGELTDVSVGSQATNTLIRYDGTNYVPTSLAEDSSGNVTSLVAGDSGNVSVNIRKANPRTTTGTHSLVGGASLYYANAAATYDVSALTVGDIVTIYNEGGGAVTVNTGGSVNLFKDGEASAVGSAVTIAADTIATVTCVSSTKAIITGSGI